jgi:hypothetical protein
MAVTMTFVPLLYRVADGLTLTCPLPSGITVNATEVGPRNDANTAVIVGFVLVTGNSNGLLVPLAALAQNAR